MSHIVVISGAAGAMGLLAAILGRSKAMVGAGALLVCASVGALIWIRPSTKRLEEQQRAIAGLCENMRDELASFRAQQDAVLYPWSEQERVWLVLAEMVTHVEPLCFPDSGWPCIPERARGLPPKSYQDIKPHLDRIIHALETHTRCRAPVPGGGMFYGDDVSGFEPTHLKVGT